MCIVNALFDFTKIFYFSIRKKFLLCLIGDRPDPFQIYRSLETEISLDQRTAAHIKNHWFNSYGSTTVEVSSKFLREFVFGFTLSYETKDGSHIALFEIVDGLCFPVPSLSVAIRCRFIRPFYSNARFYISVAPNGRMGSKTVACTTNEK